MPDGGETSEGSTVGGAYPLAVGAYNAGPGRVNEWLRRNGDPHTGAIDDETAIAFMGAMRRCSWHTACDSPRRNSTSARRRSRATCLTPGL